MGRPLIGRSLSPRRVKISARWRPVSVVPSTSQRGSEWDGSTILPAEQWMTQHCLDVGRRDVVLRVLGLIAVVPIEILRVARETIEPGRCLGIVLEPHSY